MSYMGTSLIRQDHQEFVCLCIPIVIERMSLVMTFSGFHHVLIDATLGHIPYFSGSLGRGWFVQTVLIDDMSHCYDIFGLRHVMLDVILGHTPLTSPLLSSVQAFRLCLYMDQMFRLHLHYIS